MGTNRHFNAPPGWPEPPEDWYPTPEWRPNPSWPPPPEGWVFWGEAPDLSKLKRDKTPDGRKPETGKSTRRSRYQRWWVLAYLAVVGLNVTFLILAVISSGVPAEALFAVWLGSLASVGGMLMGADLMRRGVSDRDFDDATKVMRIMVVAWVLLAGSIVSAVVLGSDGGKRANVAPEAEQALLDISDAVAAQVFGAVTFFLVVGDEYTKYRRLVTETRTSR